MMVEKVSGEGVWGESHGIRVGERWVAHNPGTGPGKGLTASFDRRGLEVRPEGATWRWGLDLVGYGSRWQEFPIDGRVPVVHTGAREVRYDWDGNLEEWYRNDPTGLEHGYTILRRPGAARSESDSRLELRLRTRGGLRLTGGTTDRELRFSQEGRQGVLRYSDLKAFDATGRELMARFVTDDDDHFSLLVEDADATYPVVIDPIISHLSGDETDGEAAGDRASNGGPKAGLESHSAILFNAPTITATAGGLSRSAGSATWSSQIATVTDPDTAAGTLTVTVTSANPSGGVTVANIVNTSGTIRADIFTACGAAAGTVTFTLEVSDGTSTATDTLSVVVSGNTAPTLTYAAATVNSGGTGTVVPATGPGDNGSVVSVDLLNPGTYTGTVTVNSSGVVSISGAAPSGSHTITIRATDNCGATTDATIALMVNAPPLITAAAGLARQGGATSSNLSIATVSDAETSAGSLTVTVNGGTSATSGGVTITNIVNSAGAITADLVAGCAATAGTATFTLQVSDGTSTATAALTVAVTANTAPVLTYNAATVNAGGSTSVNPASALSDNGTVSGIIVQNNGGFPGTLSVNSTGVVSIGGAPSSGGPYNITIRATDNCGLTTDAPFTLTVNSLPTITAATGVTRAVGTAVSNSTIATVSDTETAPGALTVSVTSANPAGGVTISDIVNTNGTITANIVAACGSTVGTASFTLQVSDSTGTATATFNVAVTANTAPVLTYAAATINAGAASTTLNPATGPSDNGTVSTIAVQNSGGFPGTIS
ncbi:MAG: beta strand repeat-containing protein, partial [Blastocatellia bacterium]